MNTVRTLILSGGGGRGAFHAGVYDYLSQAEKPGVDDQHRGVWSPDIIVGTSIGAVNGAAIVQGTSAEELKQIWIELRESDIQGLPPGMRRITRWISNLVLRQFIGVKLDKVPDSQSTSPPPQDSWLPLPVGPSWLSERLIGRWNNLLDTGPLKETLEKKFNLELEKISQSDKTLLINATNVRTGERVTFSNHPLCSRKSEQVRKDVIPGITLQRILASCSIPLIYPWTLDEESAGVYWDGAVVANTPLSGALDAAQDWPVEAPMEAIVVIMTPWIEQGRSLADGQPADALPLPQNFSEALTTTLDWALLASFRERLRVTEAYNQLAQINRAYKEANRDASLPPLPIPDIREVKVVVVAPRTFFSAARILDYDERTNTLIRLGYEAAESAFQHQFPG